MNSRYEMNNYSNEKAQQNILFYSEAWGRGGIENFIRNVAPPLLEFGYKVDIYSVWDWKDVDDSDLEGMGIHRYCLFRGFKPGQAKRLMKGVREFERLLATKHYAAVWINTMNGAGLLYAKAAYRAKVPVRVVHSHNADVGDGAKVIKRLVSHAATVILGGYPTERVACSKDAGKHLFGRKQFEVIFNGIDINRFRFNMDARRLVRRNLNISDSTVLVGNIGRISSQKNPLFQIEVFAKYKQIEPNSVYLMVGGLDQAPEVRRFAEALGVSQSVIIHGPVEDASAYYSALDVFLMPSLYEGFGYVKLEAQCAGLPVVSSDGLPSEADVTDLVTKCSLSSDPKIWANAIHAQVRGAISTASARETYADRVSARGCSLSACRESVLALLKSQLDD